MIDPALEAAWTNTIRGTILPSFSHLTLPIDVYKQNIKYSQNDWKIDLGVCVCVLVKCVR